jgi:hypothetical protein
MFGRKKKQEEVDWTTGLGQAMPPSPPPSVPGAPPNAKVVSVTTSITGKPNVQVVGNASPEQIKQAYEMAERFMNSDLDGDGKVAGGAAAPGASPLAGMLGALGTTPQPAGADVVTQLERLAKLHETGALTEEEFAAEKKKLIGG